MKDGSTLPKRSEGEEDPLSSPMDLPPNVVHTALGTPPGSAGRHPLSRIVEWVAERILFGVAVLTSGLVLLMFLFVTREALPILLGRVSTVNSREVLRPTDLGVLPPERIRNYLELSPEEFAARSPEELRLLLEVRAEVIAEESASVGDPNALDPALLVRPFQWAGYDKPAFVWQPGRWSPKYNLVPLVLGSLKVAAIAVALAVPLSLAAALHVSQLSSSRFQHWAKPALEMLSGVPGVVLGFLALSVVAPMFQWLTGGEFLLNAAVAGVALGFALIPQLFSLAEDALSGVPRELTRAALALGATRWQAAWRVVLPAARSGIVAAVLLAFGRAMGETMIVLIASGNAPRLDWSPWMPVRTLTATIAAELGETSFHGPHYRMLFLLGTLLFLISFGVQLMAALVVRRLQGPSGGSR